MTTYHLLQLIFLGLSATYHQWACWREDQTPAPGNLTRIGQTQLHWQAWPAEPSASPTVTLILDTSLGGVDGNFLAPRLASLCSVMIYDRAGYGWSRPAQSLRTSEQIVTELAELLSKAEIPPPYILLGDSFGSYNVRLFAQRFPEQVVGLVLTDGLHEQEMLSLNLPLRILKAFLWISFVLARLGAALGIIRLLGSIGLFEVIKPQLRQASPAARQRAKYSFYRAKHWATMAQEIWCLDRSGRQLQQAAAENFADLPIASVKAATFLRRNLATLFFPLGAANRARDRMHQRFQRFSTSVYPFAAPVSSHFVWIDQPEVIEQGVRRVLAHLAAPANPKANPTPKHGI